MAIEVEVRRPQARVAVAEAVRVGGAADLHVGGAAWNRPGEGTKEDLQRARVGAAA